MRLSISVTNYSWPAGPSSIGPELSHLARTADAAGFDTFWSMDHFFQIPVHRLPPEAEMLEGYTALAYIAGQTSRIKLGTLVTGVHYRHPGILVKTVSTLDVLTGGRVWLGIGAGWNEHESRSLGVPFPTRAERFEQLEETLRIAHQMWRGDTEPFVGKHYQLDYPLNSPNPSTRPRILIGGGGERKTLRLVAAYADACNLFDMGGGPTDNLSHKLDVLRLHCDNEGRSYDEIQKTVCSQLVPSRQGANPRGTSEIVERLHILANLGIDHVVIEPVHPWTREELDLAAEMVPEVAKIVPAGR